MPPGATIVLGADDTVERRSGRKIKAKGCYRDAVRSSKKHVVKCFGLKWVTMMVLVPVPWAQRVWALPFLTVLCWPPKSRHQRRHKTSVDWVRQMMQQVRRWLPERLLVLVVDGGFAAVALALACTASEVVMVSRMRLDAALYHPPGPHPAGKRGRKPTKGPRQRSLKVLGGPLGHPLGDRGRQLVSRGTQTACRSSPARRCGTPRAGPRWRFALCWCAIPNGRLADAAFFCTDLQATPTQIVEWVVMRWSVEVTFEEARDPSGLGNPTPVVRSCHRPDYAGLVRPLLPGDALGAAALPHRTAPRRTLGLVSQIDCDLRRLSDLGAAPSLAGAVFGTTLLSRLTLSNCHGKPSSVCSMNSP